MTYVDYRATLERRIDEQFAQLKNEQQTGGTSAIVATLSKIVELQRELVRLLSSPLPYIPSPQPPLYYYPQPMWWPSYPYPLSTINTESTTTDTGKKKEEEQ